MVFWLSFYVFFFVVSVCVGYRKGNLIAGVLLGYVLGPVGFILMCMSKDRKHIECPSCHAHIHENSYFCPKCRSKVMSVAV